MLTGFGFRVPKFGKVWFAFLRLLMLDLLLYFHVSIGLFFVGLWGIFAIRSNVISILISIELLLLACNVNLITFSSLFDDSMGQIFSLMVLTVAAAESAIGLALLVVYYRVRGDIFVDYIHLLKG